MLKFHFARHVTRYDTTFFLCKMLGLDSASCRFLSFQVEIGFTNRTLAPHETY